RVGVELWVTDGTPAGTHLVRNLGAGANSLGNGALHLTAFGDGVVFAAATDGNGYEPWFSDGTAEGTHVLDVAPGPASSLLPYYYDDYGSAVTFREIDGRMLFGAETVETGRELWATD